MLRFDFAKPEWISCRSSRSREMTQLQRETNLRDTGAYTDYTVSDTRERWMASVQQEKSVSWRETNWIEAAPKVIYN